MIRRPIRVTRAGDHACTTPFLSKLSWKPLLHTGCVYAFHFYILELFLSFFDFYTAGNFLPDLNSVKNKSRTTSPSPLCTSAGPKPRLARVYPLDILTIKTQGPHKSFASPAMSLLSIPVLGIVVLSILAIYKFFVYPAFLSPLSKIPNAHWSSPITPLWILWVRYRTRENRELYAAHLKHGSLIRLGPSELSVNDLAGLKTVYAGGFEKGEWYSIFDNYGFVRISIFSKVNAYEIVQSSMHVLVIVLQTSFGSKTHDFQRLFQVHYPQLSSSSTAS